VSLSLVLFLFLTHLGVGVAWMLPLVGRTAGVKFFRFNAGLAVALMAIAAALRPDATELSRTWESGLWLLGGAIVALTLYWATLGRMLAAVRPAVLWTAATAGAAALVAQAFALAPSADPVGNAITTASFLGSAALLGGACTAMVLGHWYLVLPSMDISLLQRVVRFHLVSLVIRIALVGAAVALAWRGIVPGGEFDVPRYVTSAAGIFFWQRVLFGLAAPAVLGWMTWQTAKIRSTQSATGILYVDFFMVVVGEALAKYLLLAISVPV
jgi:protein NrfD